MHLIERSQSEKVPYCVMPTAEDAGKVRSTETVKTRGCQRMQEGGRNRWSMDKFVILAGLS